MSAAAELAHLESIAYNDEFFYQQMYNGTAPLKGADHLQAREQARAQAYANAQRGKYMGNQLNDLASSIGRRGGKIYRQKRVRKSRRVSNRRRRNKSRKTKRIR